MFAYTVRRILWAIPTLLGITFIVFSISRIAPGGPAQIAMMMIQDKGDSIQVEETRKRIEEFFRLDKPIPVQYLLWLGDAVRGDLGRSYYDDRPVLRKISERIPATLQLDVFVIILELLIGLPLGILCAVKQRSLLDKVSGFAVYVLWSLPTFWVALMLQILFAVKLGWFPLTGKESFGAETLPPLSWLADRAWHMFLPLTALVYGSFAYMSRFSRGQMLEVITQDYIRTARAKGLAEKRVILRHALRNAMIPIVTHLGLILPALIGGAVILEYIFAWPGIGQLFFQSVTRRDYPVVMGLSLISAVLVLLGTLLADILYAVVDPRISYR